MEEKEKIINSPYPITSDFSDPVVRLIRDREFVKDERLRPLVDDFLVEERVSDDVILHVVERLNSDSSNKSFCLSFTRDYLADHWSEDLVSRFKNKFENINDAESIFVILNTGRHYWESLKFSSTYLGAGVDERNELLKGSHYALAIIDLRDKKITYACSTGWELPQEFDKRMDSLLETLGFQHSSFTLVKCHPSRDEISHICQKGVCSENYPLQTCGVICGVVVIIISVIGIYEKQQLNNLLSITRKEFPYSYLKNVTDFSTFLRCCVIRWLFCGSDLLNELKSKNVSVHTKTVEVNLARSIDSNKESVTTDKESSIDFNLQRTGRANKSNSIDFEYNISKETFEKLTSDDKFNLAGLTCNSENKICSNNEKKHFHCKLCEKTDDKRSRLIRHLNHSHFNKSHCVELNNQIISIGCKITGHGNTSVEDSRYHYHCPECSKVTYQQANFIVHYRSHSNEKTKTQLSSGNKNEASEENVGKVRRCPGENVACAVCSKVMLKSSLNRHMSSQHPEAESVSKSICVDRKDAIFMVRKNVTGIPYPIHVQRLIHSTPPKVYCESDKCNRDFGVSSLSDINQLVCQHIRDVDSTEIPQFPQLSEEAIRDEAVNSVTVSSTLKEEKVEECVNLLHAANSVSKPVLVPWIFPKYIHMSVFATKKHYNARLGRFVVNYNRSSGQFDCGCTRRSYVCVHKALALCYLSIDNLLSSNSPIFNELIEEPLPLTEEDGQFCDESVPASESSPEIDFALMCKYIRNEKSYSENDLREKRHIDILETPMELCPSETVCFYCKKTLSGNEVSSRKAKLITSNRVYTGFTTYNRFCSNCKIFYRYQESKDGIHNFNDSLLLGFDVCMHLRGHTLQNNSVNSYLESLEFVIDLKLDHQKLSNAYLLFEILATPEPCFKCSICGDHPWALITDVNRKIAFKCSMEDLGADEIADDFDGEVDSDEFWSDVELEIVNRAFPGSKRSKIKPVLNNWSPFMNKKSRNSPKLLNTEFKKISSRNNNAMEDDYREVCEERILEMLTQETANRVKTIARSCGFSSEGSKMDILNRIKESLPNGGNKFKKLFTKLWGHSGGWLSFSCIHGVVYYVKFLLRAESCRDYVDGILSFKHVPNVIIVDLAHMLANHANGTRREDTIRLGKGDEEGNLFYPYDGRIDDPENPGIVADATNGNLERSFPWMKPTEHLKCGENNDLNCHPVTGSERHFCLFDRFHEKNTNSEIEILRRVTIIPELNCQINTQVEEQLHRKFRESTNFLNMCSPVNHIFLFRSMLGHYNSKRDRKVVDSLPKKFNGVHYDLYGRINFGRGELEQINNHVNDVGSATISESSGSSILPPHNNHFSNNEDKINSENTQDPEELNCIEETSQMSLDSAEKQANSALSSPFPLEQSSSTSEKHGSGKVSATRKNPPRNKEKRFSGFVLGGRTAKSRCLVKVSNNKATDNDDERAKLCTRNKRKQKLSDKKVVKRRKVTSEKAKSTHVSASKFHPNEPWKLAHDDSERLLGMTLKDRSWILSGKPFGQKIMEAAMYFLKGKTWDFQCLSLGNFSPCEFGFIQIIEAATGHWVVVTSDYPKVRSNEESPENPQDKIFLFDPYYESFYKRKEKRVSYPLSLLKTIRSFIKHPGKTIKIKTMNIQQASNVSLSGPYAICLGYMLSLEMNPVSFKIDEKNILTCLIHFMENSFGRLDMLLEKHSEPKQDVLFEWEEQLFCTCLNPDYGEKFQKCDVCAKWFHSECNPLDININKMMACTKCRKISSVHPNSENILKKNPIVEGESQHSVTKKLSFEIPVPRKGGRARGLTLKNTHCIDGPLFWLSQTLHSCNELKEILSEYDCAANLLDVLDHFIKDADTGRLEWFSKVICKNPDNYNNIDFHEGDKKNFFQPLSAVAGFHFSFKSLCSRSCDPYRKLEKKLLKIPKTLLPLEERICDSLKPMKGEPCSECGGDMTKTVVGVPHFLIVSADCLNRREKLPTLITFEMLGKKFIFALVLITLQELEVEQQAMNHVSLFRCSSQDWFRFDGLKVKDLRVTYEGSLSMISDRNLNFLVYLDQTFFSKKLRNSEIMIDNTGLYANDSDESGNDQISAEPKDSSRLSQLKSRWQRDNFIKYLRDQDSTILEWFRLPVTSVILKNDDVEDDELLRYEEKYDDFGGARDVFEKHCSSLESLSEIPVMQKAGNMSRVFTQVMDQFFSSVTETD